MEVEGPSPLAPEGAVKVMWGATGVFAMDSQGAPGLPRQAIRDGGDLYVRESEEDPWTRWRLDDYVLRHPGSLLPFLDVADALRHGVVDGAGGSRLTVASLVSAGGRQDELRLDVLHDGGHVTRVRAEVEGRPGAGFVLRETDGFPFEPVVPLE